MRSARFLGKVRSKDVSMWSKNNSLTLSRLMTATFLLCLTVGMIFLKPILSWYLELTSQLSLPASLIRLFCLAAAPAYLALICLWQLLSQVSAGAVFSSGSIARIRWLSWCCFAEALVFLLFGAGYLITILICILAAFMGLILRVVKNVIQWASEIKAENDLTV